VTLNQLVLEDAAEQIREHIHAGVAEFTEAVRKAEVRAGKILAEEVKDAAAELRRELERDIEKARLEANQIVQAVHQAHTKAAIVRWVVATMIAAAGLFGAGLWLGATWLR
jgi:ribosome recycling factor